MTLNSKARKITDSGATFSFDTTAQQFDIALSSQTAADVVATPLSQDPTKQVRFSKGSSPVDTTAPNIGGLTLSYNYNENQTTGATVATLSGATDNVAVTQYRFVYADNTTSTTSEDGFFEIDSSGNIKMTASGAVSLANDYETTANSHSYKIQAGDAANNWSSAATVVLNEQDQTETDSTAPNVTGLTLSYNYNENQTTGATVATLSGATDNVAVTQYRFVYADNTTTSTTSEDGFFEIDSSGNIKMTAAGFSSIANDYETTANSHSYKIQAGDAADNWSSVATVALNEQDVDPTPGFIIMQFFDDYWGANDIFNVWVPSDSNGAFDPATTGDWYFYKNGELISDPTSYPIDYSNGRWQGQIAWSDITTFEPGDTLNIVAIVGGVTYETPVFTIA